MLEYDGIDMSEGIDVNKINQSCRCVICKYYYFLKVNFRFQKKVCNSLHDLMEKTLNLNDAMIKGNNYRIQF